MPVGALDFTWMNVIIKLFDIVKETYILQTEMAFLVDRDAKKSKISERPAEFIVHSRDNSKNFLLTKFLKIL